jgi:hypothetical protein
MMKCATCGQPIKSTEPEIDVTSLGFSVGDRVIHQGRRTRGSQIKDNGEGIVTDIAEGPHGKMSVHVLFDYVLRSGEQQRCAFDALWFRLHPDTLQALDMASA